MFVTSPSRVFAAQPQRAVASRRGGMGLRFVRIVLTQECEVDLSAWAARAKFRRDWAGDVSRFSPSTPAQGEVLTRVDTCSGRSRYQWRPLCSLMIQDIGKRRQSGACSSFDAFLSKQSLYEIRLSDHTRQSMGAAQGIYGNWAAASSLRADCTLHTCASRRIQKPLGCSRLPSARLRAIDCKWTSEMSRARAGGHGGEKWEKSFSEPGGCVLETVVKEGWENFILVTRRGATYRYFTYSYSTI